MVRDAKDETFGKIGVALGSRPGGKHDIKSDVSLSRPFDGYILDGKYVTLRDAGNMLAGANAANQKVPFQQFQQIAGGLNQRGPLGALMVALTGRPYGNKPNWGEVDYQRERSERGYEQATKEMATDAQRDAGSWEASNAGATLGVP